MPGATTFLVGCFAIAGTLMLTRRGRRRDMDARDAKPRPARSIDERAATTEARAQTRAITLPFCTLEVPKNWTERSNRSGHRFVDPHGNRVLIIQELRYPTGQGASLEVVLDFIVGQTREIARHTRLDLRLGPTSRYRRGDTVTATYRGVMGEPQIATLFEAVAGRRVTGGGYRFVSLCLQHSNGTDSDEVHEEGARLLRALVISDAALPRVRGASSHR